MLPAAAGAGPLARGRQLLRELGNLVREVRRVDAEVGEEDVSGVVSYLP
jgi:hypothetical protein